MSKRIVHFAETTKGGVSTFLQLYVEAADEYSDWRLTFILPDDSPDLLDLIERRDMDVHLFKRSTKFRLLNVFKLLIIFFWLYIKQGRGSFNVHLHSTFSGAMRPFIFFLPKINIVYCSHGWAYDMDSSFWRVRVTKLFERFMALFCDSIHCISNHDYESARANRIPLSKLRLIRNFMGGSVSLDCNEVRKVGLQEGKLNLLFVGRFDHQKGLPSLLRQFSRLERHDINLHLVGGVVAEGGDDAEVVKYVESDSRVFLHGWKSRNEVLDIMRNSHCVIVPSLWEGFGYVALEAFSCGALVLGRKVGGLQEVVRDCNGILFESDEELFFLLSRLDFEELYMFRSKVAEIGFPQKYSSKLAISNLDAVYV
jgi:glycosyltransferase involved in cell wall biosynthesis